MRKYLIKGTYSFKVQKIIMADSSEELVNHVLYKKTDYGLRGFVQKNKYNEWSINYE
jgi:hypothetical protein